MPQNQDKRSFVRWAVLAAAAFWLSPRAARAVPSFARQTGMDCSACHTVFPELTPFGRMFKLSGYTLGTVKWITAMDSAGNTRVRLSPIPPLGGMFMAQQQFTAANSLTYTSAGSDKGGSNSFPAQFSFFYAGALTSKMGAFVQTTYDPKSGYFHFDNSDIRYADNTDLLGQDFLYGVDINNNPTVQDVWNDTPAWGYPYSSPAGSQVVTPLGQPVIDSLAGQVASLGAYFYWDDTVYGEFSVYRTADPVTSVEVIQNLAPYWRLALQNDDLNGGSGSAEVGTFGLAGTLYPYAAASGLNDDNFTDLGLDAQYQYIGAWNILTLKGSYIRENQTWNAGLGTLGGNSFDHLNQLKMDATYYFDRLFGATVGYFSTVGNQDMTQYAPAEATGSNSGTPNTNGFIYELNFVPWYNTKFTLQYTDYNEFNGGGANYDGTGREAWNNNTLMLLGWFAY